MKNALGLLFAPAWKPLVNDSVAIKNCHASLAMMFLTVHYKLFVINCSQYLLINSIVFLAYTRLRALIFQSLSITSKYQMPSVRASFIFPMY